MPELYTIFDRKIFPDFEGPLLAAPSPTPIALTTEEYETQLRYGLRRILQQMIRQYQPFI